MSDNKDTKPAILTDVFGNKPPKAAESFGGRGATTLADIKDAAKARREVPVGVYDHKR